MDNVIQPPKEQFDLNSINRQSYVIKNYFKYNDHFHVELRAYNREEGFTRMVAVPLDIFKVVNATIGDIVRVDYESNFTIHDLGQTTCPIATFFEKPEGHVIINCGGNFIKRIEGDNPKHPFYGRNFVF